MLFANGCRTNSNGYVVVSSRGCVTFGGRDEATSESFFDFVTFIYNACLVETAKTSVIKRQVLVKINLWNDELLNYYGFWIPEISLYCFLLTRRT